jgi:hypothetical protein
MVELIVRIKEENGDVSADLIPQHEEPTTHELLVGQQVKDGILNAVFPTIGKVNAAMTSAQPTAGVKKFHKKY